MITRRGYSLLGAAVGLAVGGRLLGAQELWILATAGIALALLTWAWVRTRSIDLQASRSLQPPRLHVGDPGRVDLEFQNRGSRPTPVCSATDVFDDGRRAARFLIPPCAPGAVARVAYRIPTHRRGRFPLGPLTMTVADPFGLARRSRSIAGTIDVLVYPRVHDISPPPELAGPQTGPVGWQRHRRPAVGDEFLTLREYEIGDDLRRVHWKSTARLGELMIRQDETQWQQPPTIVLDTRGTAHTEESFEAAVEAAASIVTAIARGGTVVELMSASGRLLTGPRRDGASALDHLAVVVPETAGSFLGALRVRRRRNEGLLVVVAGSLDADDARLLQTHAGRNRPVLVVATRRPESALPMASGPLPLDRPGVHILDAATVPFTAAWNRLLVRWHARAAAR